MMVTRYTAAHYAYCFHVVVLELWSSSKAAHFAICFLYMYIVLMFGAASGYKSEASHLFKTPGRVSVDRS